MGIEERVENWIWQIAAKKVIAAVVGAAVGFAGAVVARNHVNVTPEQLIELQGALVAGGTAASVALHDWLKLKYGHKPLLKFIL